MKLLALSLLIVLWTSLAMAQAVIPPQYSGPISVSSSATPAVLMSYRAVTSWGVVEDSGSTTSNLLCWTYTTSTAPTSLPSGYNEVSPTRAMGDDLDLKGTYNIGIACVLKSGSTPQTGYAWWR